MIIGGSLINIGLSFLSYVCINEKVHNPVSTLRFSIKKSYFD